MEEIRNKILDYSYKAVACHIGSALSCVEILVAIKKVMKDGDFFIFSKASGISAWYAIQSDGQDSNKVSEVLKQYPLPTKGVAGIIHSVGSLGHGLPVAVGLAYSRPDSKVYCLMGDGEISEGTTWESLLFASHHELNNLIVIVDRNGLQALGKTEAILALEPLRDKFLAFGCAVDNVNGHDQDIIEICASGHYSKPTVIIAETIKGKGLDFMEGKVESHYQNLQEPCQI